MNRKMRVITFQEFKDIADERGFIFPYNYENISKTELGLIANNTFVPIEFSFEAEKTLRHRK